MFTEFTFYYCNLIANHSRLFFSPDTSFPSLCFPIISVNFSSVKQFKLLRGRRSNRAKPFDFLAQNLHEIYFRKVVINDLITSTLCCNMLGRNNEILIITSTEHDTRAEGHSRPAGQTKYYRGSSEVNFCSWNILILKLKMTRGGEY